MCRSTRELGEKGNDHCTGSPPVNLLPSHLETIQPTGQTTCLVAEVSGHVVVVIALVLARLEQVERFVGLLDVVAATVLRVVSTAAAAIALLVVVVGVVGEDVAVDARRSRRVLQ